MPAIIAKYSPPNATHISTYTNTRDVISNIRNKNRTVYLNEEKGLFASFLTDYIEQVTNIAKNHNKCKTQKQKKRKKNKKKEKKTKTKE